MRAYQLSGGVSRVVSKNDRLRDGIRESLRRFVSNVATFECSNLGEFERRPKLKFYEQDIFLFLCLTDTCFQTNS